MILFYVSWLTKTKEWNKKLEKAEESWDCSVSAVFDETNPSLFMFAISPWGNSHTWEVVSPFAKPTFWEAHIISHSLLLHTFMGGVVLGRATTSIWMEWWLECFNNDRRNPSQPCDLCENKGPLVVGDAKSWKCVHSLWNCNVHCVWMNLITVLFIYNFQKPKVTEFRPRFLFVMAHGHRYFWVLLRCVCIMVFVSSEWSTAAKMRPWTFWFVQSASDPRPTLGIPTGTYSHLQWLVVIEFSTCSLIKMMKYHEITKSHESAWKSTD